MGSRRERREATGRRIVEAAWALTREEGPGGWTLRTLAARAGMRAPSLYEYVDSKGALLDALFAEGYRDLLDRLDAVDRSQDARTVLHQGAKAYVTFAAEDPARFQLLFQPAVPGFTPSEDSMGLAFRVFEEMVDVLRAAGVERPEDVDLWTAMITGLASQQVANDPGGDRWLRLVDPAVDLLLTRSAGHSPAGPPGRGHRGP